jgi:hypothetical protein
VKCLTHLRFSCAGKCFLNMLGVFAEFETNLRSQIRRCGLRRRRERVQTKDPRSLTKTNGDVSLSCWSRRRARSSSPCKGWVLGVPFLTRRTCRTAPLKSTWSQRRSQASCPGAAMRKWLVGNPASCETVNLRNVRLLSTGADPCRSGSRARAAAVRCGFRSPRTRPIPTSSAIAQSAARPRAAASPSTSWATRGLWPSPGAGHCASITPKSATTRATARPAAASAISAADARVRCGCSVRNGPNSCTLGEGSVVGCSPLYLPPRGSRARCLLATASAAPHTTQITTPN